MALIYSSHVENKKKKKEKPYIITFLQQMP